MLELREERPPEQELLEKSSGNKEKTHVTRSEEEEQALFMVSASVLPDVPNSNSKSMEVIDGGVTALVNVELEEELQLGVTKALPGKPIQLKEERVFDQIGEKGEQREHRR